MIPTDDIDLFAGPGGTDTGAGPLGIRALGIEWDRDACDTARAAGHHRLRADIAELDPTDFSATGLMGTPPCQGFSTAGKGLGREDSGRLIAAVADIAAGSDPRPWLKEHMRDTRSLLALEPIRWAIALRPQWVFMEQVPAVLPLWEACAQALREKGYSAWAGTVQAEQYGVPQTRKRAILLASLNHEVGRPTPTHSKFYPRTPEKLDPDIPRWVSMAEALTWGMTDRPSMTVTGGGTAAGGAEPFGNGARKGMVREREAGRWMLQSHQRPGGGDGEYLRRSVDYPALTVMSGTRSARWMFVPSGVTAIESAGVVPRDVETQPAHTVTGAGNAYWVFVNGNQENSCRRTTDKPAPTIHFGARLNLVQWMPTFHDQSGTAYDSEWPWKRPSTVVAGRDLVQNPGATANRHNGSTKSRNDGVRVTVEEAAILQSFPVDYPWRGTKTACYRQVGDAVPPLLALHALSEATGIAIPAPQSTGEAA